MVLWGAEGNFGGGGQWKAGRQLEALPLLKLLGSQPLLSFSFAPRHQEVDYPHQAEVQSSCTIDRKRWNESPNKPFFFFAHFIYLLPSFFFPLCGLCVCCRDCMCIWVWSPEVALASFSMGVRVPNSGPHASAGSTVMAVLSPQPPVSLKLLPRVFWHSKSANQKRKLS